jgi:S1-C subfamily serine protease
MLGGSQSFDVLANQTAEVRVVVKRQQPKATAGFETDTRLDEFVITSIVPGGLAERAGLAIGDIVVNFAEIASTIFRGEPGATVKLVIERDDKQRTVTLTLEKP